MTSRFDIERALLVSALAPPSRHIMHVICTKMTHGIDMILPQYQPSITDLERATGYGRRTVTRHLNYLERDGWLLRHRPSVEDARIKHKRTSYTPLIPEGYPQPGAKAKARAKATPDLGSQRPEPRATVTRNSSLSSTSVAEPTPAPANIRDLCPRCAVRPCVCNRKD